jgi:methylmalonyl-CoA mutase N-terminal domain/subunit
MTAYADDKPVRDEAGPPAVERITVSLVRKTWEDLQRIQDRTGMSKTDIVNRAISAYEFIESEIQTGHDLLVRDRKTGETQLVRFC